MKTRGGGRTRKQSWVSWGAVTFSLLSLGWRPLSCRSVSSSARALRFLVASNRNSHSLAEAKANFFFFHNQPTEWGGMRGVLRTFLTRDLKHSCVPLSSSLLFLSPVSLLVLASFFSYCRWTSSSWKGTWLCQCQSIDIFTAMIWEKMEFFLLSLSLTNNLGRILIGLAEVLWLWQFLQLRGMRYRETCAQRSHRHYPEVL